MGNRNIALRNSNIDLSPKHSAERTPAGFLLIVMATAGGLICASYQQDDFISMGAIAMVTLGALNGFRRGIIGMIISLLAIGIAFHFAPQLGMTYAQAFSERLGTTGILNRFLSVAAAGCLLFAFVNIVVTMGVRIFVGKPTCKAGINNLLGFAAGGTQAAAVILLFLGGYILIDPATVSNHTEQEPVSIEDMEAGDAFAIFSNQLQRSSLRRVVERYNPFVHLPQLNKFEEVRQTVSALSDPEQVKALLDHPSIMELREDPATQRAVATLLGDPEIKKILEADQKLDETTMTQLLQNEAVLKVIDQPGFLDRAAKVIHESTKTTKSLYTSSTK